MTPEFPHFVAAIHANPKDTLGYLVLADHLEESGHGEEANKIRFVIQHSGADHAVPWEKTGDLHYRDGTLGVFYHPNHVSHSNSNPIVIRPSGIEFTTADHHIRLPHADPTFKLLREYRRAKPDPTKPISLAEAKKRGLSQQWLDAHRALSQIAFHHEHFGTERVGQKLRVLLGTKGSFESGAEPEYTVRFPRTGKYDNEGHGRRWGSISRGRRRVYWETGPRGSPTKLSRVAKDTVISDKVNSLLPADRRTHVYDFHTEMRDYRAVARPHDLLPGHTWHSFAFGGRPEETKAPSARPVMRGALEVLKHHLATHDPDVLSFSGATPKHDKLYHYLVHSVTPPPGYVGMMHPTEKGAVYALVKEHLVEKLKTYKYLPIKQKRKLQLERHNAHS